MLFIPHSSFLISNFFELLGYQLRAVIHYPFPHLGSDLELDLNIDYLPRFGSDFHVQDA